jgi:hypothetical protein
MRSTSRKVASKRNDTSSRLPIGVAQTYRSARGGSHEDERKPRVLSESLPEYSWLELLVIGRLLMKDRGDDGAKKRDIV